MSTAFGWEFERSGKSKQDDDPHIKTEEELGDIEVLIREAVQNSSDARLQHDSKVRVRIRLLSLRGSEKEEFLQAIDVEEFLREARMCQEYQKQRFATSQGSRSRSAVITSEALSEIEVENTSVPLNLLLIEDYNTAGLTGSESDAMEKSRFSACCLDDGFTVKADPASGGGVGKGKNVLWEHSSARLVLFYSQLSQPVDGEEKRFFGVGRLPFYADPDSPSDFKEWRKGRCYFGEPVGADASGDGSVRSVLGPSAERIAAATCLERKSASGTSLCIVGFRAPSNFYDESLTRLNTEELAHSIKGIAETFYWPAIHEGRLDIEVVDEATGLFLKADPESRQDLRPYIQAFDEADKEGSDLACHSTLKIPPRTDKDEELVSAPLVVSATILEVERPHGEGGFKVGTDRVALVRGAGMVVQYRPVSPRGITASVYAGVCRAGTIAPEAELSPGPEPKTPSERFETMLSTAEPEGHDRWTSSLINAKHWPSAKARVDELIKDVIPDAITRLATEQRERKGERIVSLERRFQLPSYQGKTVRDFSIQRESEPRIDQRNRIHFHVSLSPKAKLDLSRRKIQLRLSPRLRDSISGKRPGEEGYDIEQLLINGNAVESEKQGAHFYYTVPEDQVFFPLSIEAVFTALNDKLATVAHCDLRVAARTVEEEA